MFKKSIRRFSFIRFTFFLILSTILLFSLFNIIYLLGSNVPKLLFFFFFFGFVYLVRATLVRASHYHETMVKKNAISAIFINSYV